MCRSRHVVRAAVVGFTVLGLVSTDATFVRAHATFEERSEFVDGELAERPEDARLRIKRGDLLRLDGRFDEALAEYERAAELAPDLAELELARGLLFADSDRPLEALHHLDHFLERVPRHVRARKVRAACLEKLGRLAEAVRELRFVARHSDRRTPELILDQVRLLRVLGDFDRALAVLEHGRHRLGDVVVFDQVAVDVDLARGAVEAALARLDSLVETTPHRERWLARKGTILENAGRTSEAKAAWLAARRALDARPAHRRATAALQKLSATIDEELERLGAKENLTKSILSTRVLR